MTANNQTKPARPPSVPATLATGVAQFFAGLRGGVSPTIDTDRLASALTLAVAQVDGTQYVVDGSEAPYYVSVGPDPLCVCPDAAFRNPLCKHLLAALVAADDPRVHPTVQALGFRRRPTPGAHLHTVTAATPHLAAETAANLVRDAEARPPHAVSYRARSRDADPAVRQYASYALTHPSSGPTEWRHIAGQVVVEEIQLALTRMPAAMADAETRKVLVGATASTKLLVAILPHASGIEFRLLFRRLVQIGGAARALEVINDPATADKVGSLRGPDLAELFLDPNEGVRLAALRALRLVGVEQPDDPPIGDAPPLPVTVRRGR